MQLEEGDVEDARLVVSIFYVLFNNNKTNRMQEKNELDEKERAE